MEGIAVQIQCPKCGFTVVSVVVASSTRQQTCSACGHALFTSRPIIGYVYALSNPRMPGLLKIGFTTRPVDERVQELNSATGIPARFVVEAFFPSCAPTEDEQAVYNALEPHRIQRREFVELEIGDALSKIEKTLGFSPLYRRSGSREAQVDEEANHIRTPSFSMFCGPCKYQWRAEGPFVPHRCPKCNSLSISVVSQD